MYNTDCFVNKQYERDYRSDQFNNNSSLARIQFNMIMNLDQKR